MLNKIKLFLENNGHWFFLPASLFLIYFSFIVFSSVSLAGLLSVKECVGVLFCFLSFKIFCFGLRLVDDFHYRNHFLRTGEDFECRYTDDYLIPRKY